MFLKLPKFDLLKTRCNVQKKYILRFTSYVNGL